MTQEEFKEQSNKLQEYKNIDAAIEALNINIEKNNIIFNGEIEINNDVTTSVSSIYLSNEEDLKYICDYLNDKALKEIGALRIKQNNL